MKFILILSITVLNTICLIAQESKSIEHTIVSDVFETERKVKVLLPERYFRDTTQTLIVTYILDAQSDDFWNMAKNNIGYLVRQYQVIPMIAVGIVSENRGREFNPNSETLKQHLQQEVFPLIEEKYRVNEFRIVIGHSWGGAFVGNTLFSQDNSMFNAYIGISPSLDAMDEVILKNADSILKQGQTIGKYFYCSGGDIGYREDETYYGIMKMDSIVQKYPNKSLAWNYEIFQNSDHWSCVIPSINNGLIAASRHYFADQNIIENFENKSEKDLEFQIQAFNKRQEEIFGFSFVPNYKYYKFVADDFRQQEKFKAAKEMYLLSIKQGNDDAVCYFELALTYESLEEFVSAKSSYYQTLKLLEKQKETLSERFYNNLKKEIENRLNKLD